MSESIAGLGAAADSTYGQGDRRASHDENADDAGADAEGQGAADQPDLGLVIEDDPAGEARVFKTVDRRTGAVVQALPLDQVLRLSAADTYVAGQLVKTRA
jgi:hypothetical protein